MPLNLKKIPQLLATTSGWQTNADGFKIKSIWSAADSISALDPYDEGVPAGTTILGHIEADLYSLPPGQRTTPHFHPEHVEAVICWQGSGTVTFAEHDFATNAFASPPFQSTLSKLDTLVIPQHAWHSFSNAAGATDNLVLIIVHALNGRQLSTINVPLPANPPAAIPAASVRDYQRHLREPGEQFYYFFNQNPLLRAERKRVWGRDGYYGAGARLGTPDNAKAQLHITNYCFEQGQENPGHFHPFSIELVIAVEGKTTMIGRDKQMGTQEPVTGWPAENAATDRALIESGDTVLVPVAGWHRYINFEANYGGQLPAPANNFNRSLVVAMQTPHPIMHTLEMETSF